jgi:hypothetical protein
MEGTCRSMRILLKKKHLPSNRKQVSGIKKTNLCLQVLIRNMHYNFYASAHKLLRPLIASKSDTSLLFSTSPYPPRRTQSPKSLIFLQLKAFPTFVGTGYHETQCIIRVRFLEAPSLFHILGSIGLSLFRSFEYVRF